MSEMMPSLGGYAANPVYAGNEIKRGGRLLRAVRRKRGTPRAPQTGPDAREIAAAAVKTLVDKKALAPVVLDVRGLCGFADYFVICSGASRRQVSALAEYVREALKEMEVRPLGSEGADEGNWVLLDFNDVVVHIFSPTLREFYDLEGLWAEAPRVALDRFLKSEQEPAPPPA